VRVRKKGIMGLISTEHGKDFESAVENILQKNGIKYIKNYVVRTISGMRKIDFVALTKMGRVFIEVKYRDPDGDTASKRAAAEGLFIVMYEYKQLFPGEQLLGIVNDLRILKPGEQNYISLLASIGVEVFGFNNNVPDKLLTRKMEEIRLSGNL
jgi:Holliday junction resolvase